MNLLERNVATVEQRLVLIAPSEASVLPLFQNCDIDADRRRELITEMQRLRGAIYLRDGAVERRSLAPDGSHRTPEDEKSWHLMMLNTQGRVSACGWYLPHESPVDIESLRIRNCPLTRIDGVKDLLWNAVRSEVAQARRDGIGYAEIGGWAAALDSGSASEGLLLALAGYSLSRALGGALGTTTATVRHYSSTILRRLGGSSLEFDGQVVPTYYDATYRCDMELLRFDSRTPNVRYAGLIEELRGKLAGVQVFAKPASEPATTAHEFVRMRRAPVHPVVAA